METESIKLEVHVTASYEALSSEILSTAVITLEREFEEFIKDENDGSIKSIGSYPASSSPDKIFIPKLPTFKPDDVYQTLLTKLHDVVMSKQIANEMVVHVQRRLTSQSSDHYQPLFLLVSAKLTQKVYIVVPCYSAPEESPKEDSETCAICLENLVTTDKTYSQMPHCSHCFHETCVTEWTKQLDHNSCPLCRKIVNKKTESN